MVALSYVDKLNQYIDDIESGRVSVCRQVKQLYSRHKDDLNKSKTDASYPYKFDVSRAERVVQFIEMQHHTKAKWAARKQRLHLENWQVAFIMVLFGWLYKEDNNRRFRTCYFSVPRKNGKSILAAAMGLYMGNADGETSAEIYCGATTLQQAKEVFTPAKRMCELSPNMCAAFGIDINAQSLVFRNSGRFTPVIGRGKDGSSPSMFICDEFHQHETSDLIDSMTTGMMAREQPLTLITTTAGSNNASPCKLFQMEAEKMLSGTIENDELFALIYTIDPEDDWTTEAALRKANPNADVSIDIKVLQIAQREAIQNAAKQNIFKIKHMNVWVNASSSWMNMQSWAAAATPQPFTADFLKSCECYIGLDMSSTKDITAVVKVFRKKENNKYHYYIVPKFYLPELQTQDPTKQHYQKWVASGDLIATDGGEVDYSQIIDDLLEDAKEYNVKALCYDPWNAAHITQEFTAKTGITRIEVRQTPINLSEPMKRLESGVIAGVIHHDNNPCMNWQIANVIAHEDKKDNIFPNKARPQDKIDGAAATITALSQAIVNQVERKYTPIIWI